MSRNLGDWLEQRHQSNKYTYSYCFICNSVCIIQRQWIVNIETHPGIWICEACQKKAEEEKVIFKCMNCYSFSFEDRATTLKRLVIWDKLDYGYIDHRHGPYQIIMLPYCPNCAETRKIKMYRGSVYIDGKATWVH